MLGLKLNHVSKRGPKPQGSLGNHSGKYVWRCGRKTTVTNTNRMEVNLIHGPLANVTIMKNIQYFVHVSPMLLTLTAKIATKCVQPNPIYDESTFIQVMALCHRATSHYLSEGLSICVEKEDLYINILSKLCKMHIYCQRQEMELTLLSTFLMNSAPKS